MNTDYLDHPEAPNPISVKPLVLTLIEYSEGYTVEHYNEIIPVVRFHFVPALLKRQAA